MIPGRIDRKHTGKPHSVKDNSYVYKGFYQNLS